MAYGRFKSMGSLGLFHCIWQLVDHLPFAYVEKQSLSYGRKEVPFATWCFMIKANGRLSTICQTSVIVSISLSTMCHKSKICNLPYAIYHPSLSHSRNLENDSSCVPCNIRMGILSATLAPCDLPWLSHHSILGVFGRRTSLQFALWRCGVL